MVNTLAVFRELISRNLVCAHVGGVSVTMGARIRDVDGIDGRTRIAGHSQIVDAVAVGADCNFRVTTGEPLPVYAGLVLAQLIGAQAGVVLPHVGGIGVTAST